MSDNYKEDQAPLIKMYDSPEKDLKDDDMICKWDLNRIRNIKGSPIQHKSIDSK